MERHSDPAAIEAALHELRPAPRNEFAAVLDERVAAGFPRSAPAIQRPFAAIVGRLRSPGPRRLSFATAGASVALVAIATAIVVSNDVPRSPTTSLGGPLGRGARPGPSLVAPNLGRSSAAAAGGASAESATALGGASPTSLNGAFETLSRHREVERSAEISLLADPGDVASDAAKVFDAVHGAHGIVLRSNTTSGSSARADFDLLIPSAKLGDALAALSEIDEVRSRHEATGDITAPTVSLRRQLASARARIDDLLARLSGAGSETEAEAIEAELRDERGRARRLAASLNGLKRRVELSRVSVRIESGPSETGGAWGIDDAFGDAGRILSTAAGVTVVGLAVLGPLALACLLAWLAQRAWLRRTRERSLL